VDTPPAPLDQRPAVVVLLRPLLTPPAPLDQRPAVVVPPPADDRPAPAPSAPPWWCAVSMPQPCCF